MSAGEADRLLHAYGDLLRDPGVRLGVVSSGDRERIWDRHILDSLRAVRCLRAEDRALVDLGSGGGLPGIPVAIARPDLRVVLVEPRQRRVAFLELVVERLTLDNVVIVAGAAADVVERFDVCLVRAVAEPLRAWTLGEPLLAVHGAMLYFAGRSWGDGNAASLRDAGVRVHICAPSPFAWQGPLVMMGRPGIRSSPGELNGP